MTSQQTSSAGRLAYLCAALAVLILPPIVGTVIGKGIGNAVCNDSEYEFFRCFNQELEGMAWGFGSGVAVGVVGAALIWLKWRAVSRGRE